MRRERRITLLEGAIDEIKESKNIHKSLEVREHYLNNATRFIQEVLEDIQGEERNEDEMRMLVVERVKKNAFLFTCSYETGFRQLNEEAREGFSFDDIEPYLVPGGNHL